ncbi:uncharacterized protein LOC134256665 isoform X1 [Saccostrea cucullata]|uniref:uncharacterized protein LOC134256665 isoform X1 n=1 Tax=Saccostrea cuccullata TaxID=36930 RepID=UPI002ED5C2ED
MYFCFAVNSSNQKQRFKVKLDESSQQRSVQDKPSELSGDMKKLDIEEKGYQKDTGKKTSDKQSVSDEEITQESLNTESESLKGNEAAAFVEKEEEVVEDSRQNVPEKSEISGIIRVSKDVSGAPEKKITMVDFAGQCSYYASHQIFLSPRAFFILVLNMEKKFDDKVGKEVCSQEGSNYEGWTHKVPNMEKKFEDKVGKEVSSQEGSIYEGWTHKVPHMEKKFEDKVGKEVSSQEGSIYEGWTHKDYLTFWATSIHQYSSEKAPVLLVGTHAEKKTKEEKEKFFRDIWTILETNDASLQRHIDRKRMFAVGFHENESIEKIKLSVVDVVRNLDHWGEKLPHSWAMFENFFQEKKNLKVINKETLLDFNDALPQELKLETIEDINTMLQFFHDIREILHFNQESLRGIIILDVQWFADAFKNVITDKNHAAEDLFELASQWDKFNESGELSDTLLSAIWEMNNNGFLEHKDEIMRYMEKLGLLAKMDDKRWYVPCMNKRPFPVHRFSAYPASSILCFLFDALPVGIFQRLVARCMEFPWALVKEIKDGKERPLIYQTAAVFLFEDDHNILLGMTPTEIQLQVFVSEGDVDISTCFQIREKIESELYTLSSTFQRNLKFHTAFKCKPEGFCDNNRSAVIYESDLRGPTFQCPSCPEGKKHIVCIKDITKYWIQVQQLENEDEGDISNSSIEMILNAVSRKLVNITSPILATYFGVTEQPPTMCVEEDRFRILYKWKCANSTVDHKKELERILREAEQEEAADYVGTFRVSDFVCSDLMEPNRYVSNKECRMLSEKLSKEYTHLVRFLRLPHVRIEQLEADVRTIRERIYKSLLKVREECPNLSRRDLCRALNFVERSDVIDYLKEQWK